MDVDILCSSVLQEASDIAWYEMFSFAEGQEGVDKPALGRKLLSSLCRELSEKFNFWKRKAKNLLIVILG